MPGNGISVMLTNTATIIFYRCVMNGFDGGVNSIKISNLYFEFLLTHSRTNI